MPFMPRQADCRARCQFLQSRSKPGKVRKTECFKNLLRQIKAKGLPLQSKARASVFIHEGGTHSEYGRVAWIPRGRVYWMGMATKNFQPISANGTNIINALRGVDDSVVSEFDLRSAETLLPRVRAPPPAP
ncbi:hypothetical protein PoB_005153100 [Plakobranchus ocellatus]|uniref:Uncharacterized protein n=1 Tax=Plakobranchus ocellatus TaxID=259542 RepID=A0AAV4BWY2_9GAST|nr:hypothetical protein PoB_005153100 [Plakobranchus ocellatus]